MIVFTAPLRVTSHMVCLFYFLLLISLSTKVLGKDRDPLDPLGSINPNSRRSRSMVSLQAAATSSPNFRAKRSTYPETEPLVCLAFLSCCQRTDLLNHTIAGAIRHMEEDEPSYLRYEIAWVDNGNSPEATNFIKDSYPIEHALTLPKNMGLAYGMNLLVNNLCTAPYILLLEEDWLYLDKLVAAQTDERKRAITTSIGLLEDLQKNNVTAFDGRNIIGVFLRHETYDSILTFPHADVWEKRENVDLSKMLSPSISSDSCSNKICRNKSSSDDEKETSEDDDHDIVDIDYQVFCADTAVKSGSTVWGSYTNGAGLYRRSDLIKVGRQFGEPGDAFHDRYVEANYAYRVGLGNCHAALRLTKNQTCTAIYDSQCTGAFHHIGGGRGTRPRTAKGTKCMDVAWNFYGTPLYEKYHKFAVQSTGISLQQCSRQELQGLRDEQFRETDGKNYREQVRLESEKAFMREAEERQNLRDQARVILTMLAKDEGDDIRQMVPAMLDFSDDEIAERAHHMTNLANSPHPLLGLWDNHGRVRKIEEE
mmetsp:Transcript_8986/g.19406  ORF Transcript_8986/g.19406 Transcript_8986/m.19406 type:complete len:537 (-) Transcript_8986:287-1897(-)